MPANWSKTYGHENMQGHCAALSGLFLKKSFGANPAQTKPDVDSAKVLQDGFSHANHSLNQERRSEWAQDRRLSHLDLATGHTSRFHHGLSGLDLHTNDHNEHRMADPALVRMHDQRINKHVVTTLAFGVSRIESFKSPSEMCKDIFEKGEVGRFYLHVTDPRDPSKSHAMAFVNQWAKEGTATQKIDRQNYFFNPNSGLFRCRGFDDIKERFMLELAEMHYPKDAEVTVFKVCESEEIMEKEFNDREKATADAKAESLKTSSSSSSTAASPPSSTAETAAVPTTPT